MADPDITTVKTEASRLADRIAGIARRWLRRNVWGVVAVAAAAALIAALALYWG